MWYRDKIQSEDKMQYSVGNHINLIKSLESSKTLALNESESKITSLNIPQRSKERPLSVARSN